MGKEMRLDFSNLPVIDDHCHLFNLAYEPHDLPRMLSMSLHDMPHDQLQQTLIYRIMLREIRELLQMDGPDQAVLEARESRMEADYAGFVTSLLRTPEFTPCS